MADCHVVAEVLKNVLNSIKNIALYVNNPGFRQVYLSEIQSVRKLWEI